IHLACTSCSQRFPPLRALRDPPEVGHCNHTGPPPDRCCNMLTGLAAPEALLCCEGRPRLRGKSTAAGGQRVTLLDVQDVTVRFGGIMALDSLTFDIDDREICGLIGPNGAGKTTMFNVVSRIYQPTSGRITFDGR